MLPEPEPEPEREPARPDRGKVREAAVQVAREVFAMHGLPMIRRRTVLTMAADGISWRKTFYTLSELRKEEWVLKGLFDITGRRTKR